MNNSTIGSRPESGEYAPYYEKYVMRVSGDDSVFALHQLIIETQTLLSQIDEEKALFRYAEGKWSIKELVGHLIDTERIFGFRALCFARNDQNAIAGMEQDDYVRNADFDRVEFAKLAEEFRLVRNSTIAMFENFPAEAWVRSGTASDNLVSVRALAFMIAGHEIHHINILKERYLV
jgi:DinB superfamily